MDFGVGGKTDVQEADKDVYLQNAALEEDDQADDTEF
jgi:hypothetical protein